MLHAVCVCECVSVCLSVTFVHSVKTNKDIFEIFASSGSHNIIGVVGRNHDSEPISGFNACNRPGVVNTAGGGPRPPSRKLWRLYRWSYTAGIWPPSLWFYSARPTKRALALYTITVDRESLYDSKARRYAEDNRTESNCTHSLIRSRSN